MSRRHVYYVMRFRLALAARNGVGLVDYFKYEAPVNRSLILLIGRFFRQERNLAQ